MPARPIWRGQIRLALVSIPVEIYSATRSGAAIQFHQVHEPSGKRVKYEKVVPGIGPIDRDEIVKGYEVSKGHYVLLDPEEIEAVKLESKKTLEEKGLKFELGAQTEQISPSPRGEGTGRAVPPVVVVEVRVQAHPLLVEVDAVEPASSAAFSFVPMEFTPPRSSRGPHRAGALDASGVTGHMAAPCPPPAPSARRPGPSSERSSPTRRWGPRWCGSAWPGPKVPRARSNGVRPPMLTRAEANPPAKAWMA